uniref:Uncharacterized protein n=1 Tax=Glossina palpalis gambiensis TaxID=67801 RepID=A0A1B0BWI4_9MUSC
MAFQSLCYKIQFLCDICAVRSNFNVYHSLCPNFHLLLITEVVVIAVVVVVVVVVIVVVVVVVVFQHLSTVANGNKYIPFRSATSCILRPMYKENNHIQYNRIKYRKEERIKEFEIIIAPTTKCHVPVTLRNKFSTTNHSWKFSHQQQLTAIYTCMYICAQTYSNLLTPVSNTLKSINKILLAKPAGIRLEIGLCTSCRGIYHMEVSITYLKFQCLLFPCTQRFLLPCGKAFDLSFPNY